MFTYLILLFTIVPAVELFVLIKVGTVIGAGNTILIIIFTGVLGAYLARLQGFLVFMKIQESLNRGEMPNSELIDGVLILVGGIVLLTPGFVTDFLGFLLLIPSTRNMIKYLVKKKFESQLKKGQFVHIETREGRYQGPHDNGYDDIDIN